MELARIRRGSERSKMLRIKTFLASHPPGTENSKVSHYKVRLDYLIESFASFNQFHNELITFIQIDNEEQIQSNQHYYLQVKEEFHVLQKELLYNISVLNHFVYIDESKKPVLQSSTINSSEHTVPSFSGDYNDWPIFFDVFTSLIHLNHNLSDVIKLMYLKSSLEGDALAIVQYLAVTNYNYSTAWNKITKKYGNQSVSHQPIVLQTQSFDVSKSNAIQPISCDVPTIENHPFNSTSSNHNKSSDKSNTVHNQISFPDSFIHDPHSTQVSSLSNESAIMNNSLLIETFNDLENNISEPVQIRKESLHSEEFLYTQQMESNIHKHSTLIIINQTKTVGIKMLSSHRDIRSDHSFYYQDLDKLSISTIHHRREQSSNKFPRKYTCSLTRKLFIDYTNTNAVVVTSILANWKKGDVKQILLNTNSSLRISCSIIFEIRSNFVKNHQQFNMDRHFHYAAHSSHSNIF